MLPRICFLLVFLVALPAFCQVEPSAESGSTAREDEMPMMTPPLVSGIAYPSVAGADVRSNYLVAGLTLNAGYTNNVFPADTSTPLSDYTYIINPTFSYDRVAPRQHTTFAYNPGFSFYQPDSVLDSIDQSASFRFEERLSPGAAFSVSDSFMRTSDVFNESFPFPGGIGGTTQSPVPAVLAPFAEQTANNAVAAISYQFGSNAMVGGGGGYSLYSFSTPNQSQGLYNSTGESASAFYVGRFAGKQYVGLDYQYSRTVATPPNVWVDTQMQTLLPFFAIYFSRSFSVSAAAGAQNTNVTQTSQPATGSWSPAVVASTGWQGPRTSLALSYQRVITAGEGLGGAYKSSSVNVSGAWKISRSWDTGASAGYTTIDPALLLPGQDYQGGSIFIAGVKLGHTIREHFSADLGYDRLHENYGEIPAIAASPNTDREYVTVTYKFTRPLGR